MRYFTYNIGHRIMQRLIPNVWYREAIRILWRAQKAGLPKAEALDFLNTKIMELGD
jgi:hypothetical protein